MRVTALVVLSASLALSAPDAVAAPRQRLTRVANAQPIELYHPARSQKGTLLFFHGYTGTPKQWEAEAKHRFAEGYDVIVAALPGHGYVDGKAQPSGALLPKAHEAGKYGAFARSMFDKASARSGGKVHVIGLSVGGAHALEVALGQRDRLGEDGAPALRSAVAVNPYLGLTPRRFGPFKIEVSKLLSNVDRMTFGLLGRALSLRDHQFDVREREKHEADMIGLRAAPLGAVLAIGRFGDQVAQHGENVARGDGGLAVPTFVVVTEGDPTANPVKTGKLIDRIGATKVAVAGKVHNLISPHENPDVPSQRLVRDTITRALEAGEQRTSLW